MAAWLAWSVARIGSTLPTVTQIAGYRPAEPTRIYSSDGVLLATLKTENRKVITLSQVSPWLVQATVAVEDARFYEHRGLDWRAVARAAVENLAHANLTRQGASTITQQLARNISQFRMGREKSIQRKLREAMTAVRIEQVFGKDEILELYLNQIYYGAGAYGVEAASRLYFGKAAADLSLPEAALLAGLPQRPCAYSPFEHAGAARERRNVVLRRMMETGKITTAQYGRSVLSPVRLAARRPRPEVCRAPHFVDWVLRGLLERHGSDRIYSGCRVVTTLNWRMQEEAEAAIRHGLRRPATQAALVSLDPHTGEVRALVGGTQYSQDQFNAVTQGCRQPGSAFKPIVYAAALDTGTVALDTQAVDEPAPYPGKHGLWTPRNYSGRYSQRHMTILEAIAKSVNTVAVCTAVSTGLDRVVTYARAMGISTPLQPYPSLALGACAVRPLDLCAVYASFAADGVRYRPTGVQEVTGPDGDVIERDNGWQRRGDPVIQLGTVQAVNKALREVVLHGTGAAASSVSGAFGKTGTTSDYRDAWFAGYTANLATVVWVANPERGKNGVVHYRPMPGATGGSAAAPIWSRFMRAGDAIQRSVNSLRHSPRYVVTLPPAPDAPGGSAEIAAETDRSRGGGQARGNTTPVALTYAAHADAEISQAGTVNAQAGRSGLVSVCAESGMLATEWCDTTVLMNASAAPHRLCDRHRAPAGEPRDLNSLSAPGESESAPPGTMRLPVDARRGAARRESPALRRRAHATVNSATDDPAMPATDVQDAVWR